MRTVSAAVRWKNGDRQFVDVEVPLRDEIMWRVGERDGGGHEPDAVVFLRLWSRFGPHPVYAEYP